VALAVLLAMAAMAALGGTIPWVQRHDPAAVEVQDAHASPSAEHWLGTDNLGRDTWARTWEGIGISLRVALAAQVVVVVIGVALGSAAALGGRFVDALVMRGVDAAYAVPDLLAIILLRAVLSERAWPLIGTGDPQIPGFPATAAQVTLAIALAGWVTIARLVRGQMLSLRETPFVEAARGLGASQARLVWRHMLPNAMGPVIVAATFGIPLAIYAEAVLAIIGFGVAPPTASLGTLVIDGYTYMRTNPWMLTAPVAAIATMTLCFTLVGDGLRDALDPRMG
jgi:oligopeptide transport system permease protein